VLRRSSAAGLFVTVVGLATSCTSTPPSVGNVEPPPFAARVDYQLGGPYPPDAGVRIVVRDRTADPVEGLYNVCYLNAFQAQPGEEAQWRIDGDDLSLRDRAGNQVVDRDWDEVLLDTSSPVRRAAIARVVTGWIDDCGRAGFRAIELDNLDSWSRSDDLLTPEDNLSLAGTLVAAAHQLGLAVAQKNSTELGTRGRDIGFDFAIAEECQYYHECDSFTDVYGPAVIEIEYSDQPESDFLLACRLRGSRISVVRRDRGLVPSGAHGHLAQWC
jgi:hypothetical protein